MKDQLGQRNDFQTVLTLLPYLWPRDEPALRARVVMAVGLLVAAKATNVVVPFFYKYAVDTLNDRDAAVVVVPVALLVAYGFARVMAQAFGELRDAVFARVAQRAIQEAGLKTFRHLHTLSLRFHLDRQTGAVSRAIERGTKAIEFVLNFTLFSVLPTLLEVTLVCGILWRLYGPAFALITFTAIATYIAWTLTVTNWRTKFRRLMNLSDSEAMHVAIDSLLNFETIKYFGNEEHEARRFGGALRVYEDAAVKSKTSLSLLNIGQGAIISVGLIVVMVMAGNGVVTGAMTVGDFVLVNTFLIQLYVPLGFLGSVYRRIKQSLTDLEQMFRLLREPAEIVDAPEARPLASGGGEVVFEDVSFAYDPRRRVLESVSFRVPAGKTLAIVGHTGSGKTTISRLLYRFYDVTGGRILIDGQDIRQITQDSLRATIGIVPQDTVLFNETIFYNIAYGNPQATLAQVEEAARLACIHDFIMHQPDGYQTMVGERGLKLSGGEKQRVAIARTILKKPRVFLFDEATSALDTRTERKIQAALAQVSEGCTTLVIAHRLSTVVDADEILVLEAGRIVEQGSHAQLLARGDHYAGMWRRQQEAAQAQAALERASGAPRLAGKDTETVE